MDSGRIAVEALLEASDQEYERIVGEMDEASLLRLAADWPGWRHDGQAEPAGDWRVWVALCGRGFGKTRAGAEWVSEFARSHNRAAIALVAATADEARRVMVEGPRSGLLAVARRHERDEMLWEPSRGRLVFASGAEAFVYSGANGEGLRGAEHHIAWCDELAKWKQAQAAWDNLQLGLRLGERPRTLVTTTPRASAALRRVLAEPGVATTGGASWDNPHSARAFVEAMRRLHGGTRLGRQELEGVLLEEVEGALWTWELIEKCRVLRHGASTGSAPAQDERDSYRRVVIGVDPPASAEGACGIVACALDGEGIAYVIGDHSAAGLSPEGWARKAATAAQAHGADRIVAEANQGGAMVESVLRAAGASLPVKRVHAAEGKAARAEPVAALFESGRAKLAGRFPELEAELRGLTVGGGYEGPGRSPDRADAMVWAMAELMLGPKRAEPRILRL
jgi:phage terminase large subunit-like protein